MKKFIVAVCIGIIFFLFVSLPLVSAQETIENNVTLNRGFIETSLSTNLSPVGVTVEAWIYPDDVNRKQVLVSIGNNIAGSRHYELGIEEGYLSFYYHFGPRSERLLTGGMLSARRWNHIAGVVSADASHIFINGTEAVRDSGAISLAPLSGNVVVGNTHLKDPQNPFAFIGVLDELRISSSGRDIIQLWEREAYGQSLAGDPQTILLWHFNQTRGETRVADSSGNQLTGTLVGGDEKIHFSGAIPTPIQAIFATPTPKWNKPMLPTLPQLMPVSPTSSPLPTSGSSPLPTPTLSSIRQFLRRLF